MASTRTVPPSLKTPPAFIIETEKGVPVTEHSDAQAIASLKEHPGMKALLNRLRLQKEFVITRLTTGRHKDIRDVDCLQLGASWLGYLDEQIREATKTVETRKPRAAYDYEVEEFDRVSRFIERVGTTSPEE